VQRSYRVGKLDFSPLTLVFSSSTSYSHRYCSSNAVPSTGEYTLVQQSLLSDHQISIDQSIPQPYPPTARSRQLSCIDTHHQVHTPSIGVRSRSCRFNCSNLMLARISSRWNWRRRSRRWPSTTRIVLLCSQKTLAPSLLPLFLTRRSIPDIMAPLCIVNLQQD
jgi:hypothetical protein